MSINGQSIEIAASTLSKNGQTVIDECYALSGEGPAPATTKKPTKNDPELQVLENSFLSILHHSFNMAFCISYPHPLFFLPLSPQKGDVNYKRPFNTFYDAQKLIKFSYLSIDFRLQKEP